MIKLILLLCDSKGGGDFDSDSKRKEWALGLCQGEKAPGVYLKVTHDSLWHTDAMIVQRMLSRFSFFWHLQKKLLLLCFIWSIVGFMPKAFSFLFVLFDWSCRTFTFLYFRSQKLYLDGRIYMSSYTDTICYCCTKLRRLK